MKLPAVKPGPRTRTKNLSSPARLDDRPRAGEKSFGALSICRGFVRPIGRGRDKRQIWQKELPMHLNTYLNFNGNCEAAFKFYEECLGGKIEAITPYEGSPAGDHVPVDWRKNILHARLAVNRQVPMGSDVPPTPHSHYDQPRGFSVSVQTR